MNKQYARGVNSGPYGMGNVSPLCRISVSGVAVDQTKSPRWSLSFNKFLRVAYCEPNRPKSLMYPTYQ